MAKPWTRCLAATAVAGLLVVMACGSPPEEAAPRDMTKAFPAAVEGWQAVGEVAAYDTESIFGYIDGHAEVYLAYGMRRCLSQRYAGPEGEPDIIVDLFELASPADAYGVFTHDRDGEEVGVGQGGLYRSGWLSFWQGPWFGSIYVEGESAAARPAVIELGSRLAGAVGESGEPPEIVALLPEAGLDPRSVRFLRAQEILNGVYFVGFENPFGLGPETAAAIGRYELAGGAGWLLLVRYHGEQAASRAAARAEAEGLAVRRDGTLLAAVLGPEPPEFAASLLEAVRGATS